MPAALTYPGVYVEEIPSGVRTITGVATSITAFVGRALRGPVDRAVVINGFGDFERRFGGLWLQSQLGYAVRDFFLNGGSQAIIVRLYGSSFASPEAEAAANAVADATDGSDAADAAAKAKTKADTYANEPEKSAAAAVAAAAKAASLLPNATPLSVHKAAKAAVVPARAPLTIGELQLEAAYEGAWGGKLRGRTEASANAEVAQAFGVQPSDLFNLTVRDARPGGASETYLNVTVVESPRRIDRVLQAESALVRVQGDLPPSVSAGTDAVTAAEDEVAAAKAALDAKIKAGASEQEIAAARDAWNAKRDALAAKYAEADKAASDGRHLRALDFLPDQGLEQKKGLYALEQADLFNLLCIPPYKSDDGANFDAEPIVLSAATAYCERRRAFHLIDPPSAWNTKEAAIAGLDAVADPKSRNAAIFFPRLRQPNLLRDNSLENFAPCGAVAGIFARTDAARGVWKAPAGLDASLVGVPQLSVPLTDAENGELNPLGINCLRAMPVSGRVVWGARTLRGADQLADEYKYTPVRRTALFIEESLFRGLKWVVFEPNDEPLWAQIRLNVGAFMNNLFRQGAFQGSSARDAYFVRCDKDTTTQNDINLGVVNVVVGFAPLKPAEFVVLRIQQIAGQIDV
ncbi:phage tail sheath subtilisin-like domain-containing protein [Lysobacter sp. BMK333-48F3]|uniref:phage tail sheath family protein n=1 Tax=Lysobacter sp. BMK333-48F3 TaxID=2867962 RepID=UPI001C8CB696|nr:phage tail sheath C-terminal domain-containing protein [Lysobacter sp. BMK333-48F3]MBX9403079.1 phage tail sheath subtilisin-like domain-containing protein [Lysobacter sp. BMK333-48F3]